MGLIGNVLGGSGSSSTCTPEPSNYSTAEPLVGSWTFHHLMVVISGALFAAGALILLLLGFLHLTHYSKPYEQRQLVRAINAPWIFGLTSLLSVAFYSASYYVAPLGDLYETFALVAMFLYMIALVSPDESRRDSFFGSLENVDHGQVVPGGSLAWFRRAWIGVFQMIPVRIITTIATWIVAGTVCHTENRFRTFNTIINAINGVSVVYAILAILRVHGRLKPQLAGKHVIVKLMVLKLIVGILVIQRLVFSILQRTNTLKGSAKISQADLEIGLPNFLISCEAFIFAILFLIPYSFTPYTEKNVGPAYRNKWNFFLAFFHVWNIIDLVLGCFDVFKMGSMMRSSAPVTSTYTSRPVPQPAPVHVQQMKYEDDQRYRNDVEANGDDDNYDRRHHHHHDRHHHRRDRYD